jgi:hypothetical protein
MSLRDYSCSQEQIAATLSPPQHSRVERKVPLRIQMAAMALSSSFFCFLSVASCSYRFAGFLFSFLSLRKTKTSRRLRDTIGKLSPQKKSSQQRERGERRETTKPAIVKVKGLERVFCFLAARSSIPGQFYRSRTFSSSSPLTHESLRPLDHRLFGGKKCFSTSDDSAETFAREIYFRFIPPRRGRMCPLTPAAYITALRVWTGASLTSRSESTAKWLCVHVDFPKTSFMVSFRLRSENERTDRAVESGRGEGNNNQTRLNGCFTFFLSSVFSITSCLTSASVQDSH